MSTKRGRYRFATKVFVEYLSGKLPGVWVTTAIPADRHGKMVVLISSVPAGDVLGAATRHHSPVLAWRRLVFVCIGDDEEAVADLCEEVRSLVYWARTEPPGQRPCRWTDVVGEPGAIHLPDEPVPRFQTTLDVLMRESYRLPAIA